MLDDQQQQSHQANAASGADKKSPQLAPQKNDSRPTAKANACTNASFAPVANSNVLDNSPKCESCGAPHDGTYGSARFCSSTCAKKVGAKIKWGLMNNSVKPKASAGTRIQPSHILAIPSSEISALQVNPPDNRYMSLYKEGDEVSISNSELGAGMVAEEQTLKGPRVCEGCGKQHDGSYGSGRYCACSCARRKAAARKWEKQRRQDVVRKPDANIEPGERKSPLPLSNGGLGKRQRTHSHSPEVKAQSSTSVQQTLPDRVSEKAPPSSSEQVRNAAPIAVAPVPLRPVPHYYSSTPFSAFGPVHVTPMATYFHPLQCNPYTSVAPPYAPFTAPSPGLAATPPPPPPPTPAPLLTGVNAQGQPQVVAPVHLFAPQAQVSSRRECESVAEALLCLSAPSPALAPSPVPIAKANVKSSPIVPTSNLVPENNTTTS